MNNQHVYTTSQTGERLLNQVLIQADISQGFDAYLDIFDAFYADDVEVSSNAREEPVHGKANVRSLLMDFLVPLHVMAELGSLSVSTRAASIHGDAATEMHSAWTLDFVGASGATCRLSWQTLRKWRGSHFVYERHYDRQQTGGPLTFDDLHFNGTEPTEDAALPTLWRNAHESRQ